MIWHPITSHDGSPEHLTTVAEWNKRPHRATVVRWSQAGYEQRKREQAIAAFFAEYCRSEGELVMMSLEALINDCVAVKRGDKEFALFRWHDGTWMAEIGNPRADVSLGECDGEFKAEGETAIAAVRALTVLLKDQPLTRHEEIANERAGKVFDVITRTWIEPPPASTLTQQEPV